METVLLCVGLIFLAVVLAVLLRDDWPFITRPLIRVEAEVVRHDRSFSDGDDAWRAVFAFTDEAGTHREALDLMLFQNPRPDIGTRITLTYPKGTPDKARVRRPVLRGLLYGVLGFMAVALVGRLLGWVASGSG